MSELFDWIKAQEAAGTVDSSGVFTLEKSKAWEKLGAYALPQKHSWALKLVQSAVSAGGGLRVEQRRSESVFFWTNRCEWTHEQVEQAVLDPEPSADRSLEHLAVGLRALARAAALPFAIGYQDGRQAIWTGSGFEIHETSSTDVGFRVGVSHFKVGESTSLFSLKNLAAGKRSAEISRILTSEAHLMPSHLSIDGREINNLMDDPVFGASNLRQPLYLFRVPSHSLVPDLKVKAHFQRRTSWSVEGLPEINAADGEAVQTELPALQEPGMAVVLVSSMLGRTKKGKSYEYHALAKPSQLVWVSDGVVVGREDLPLPNGSTPMVVVCSAAGLETDLSGLVPRLTEARAERRDTVMRGVARCLVESDLDAKVQSRVQKLHLGLMAVGGMVFFVNPVAGLALMGGGGLQYLQSRDQISTIEAALDLSLVELRDRVTQRWPLS